MKFKGLKLFLYENIQWSIFIGIDENKIRTKVEVS